MIAFGIITFSTEISLKANPDPKVWVVLNAEMAQYQAVPWVFCPHSNFSDTKPFLIQESFFALHH